MNIVARILISLIVINVIAIFALWPSSEAKVRGEVLLLKKDGVASCSAVRVLYTGGYYVLSAAHCLPINFDGFVLAYDEQNNKFALEILDLDPTADLMLLSNPWHSGVQLAGEEIVHEHVYTITHGAGLPSYRTNGELVVVDKYITGLDQNKTITTAPIVPGSSGGPLFNFRGELLGIVTNIDSYGFSYATPIASIKRLLDQYRSRQ